MSIKITSEKNITMDQLLAEANTMCKSGRRGEYSLEYFQSQHKQFCVSYPIVAKYIFYENEYNAISFEQHVVALMKNAGCTEEEYINHQAEYVADMLHRNHGCDKNAIKKIASDSLNEERLAFRKQVKQAESEVAELEKDRAKRNKAELISLCAAIRNN